MFSFVGFNCIEKEIEGEQKAKRDQTTEDGQEIS